MNPTPECERRPTIGNQRGGTGLNKTPRLPCIALGLAALFLGAAPGWSQDLPTPKPPQLQALSDKQINQLLGPPGGHVISTQGAAGGPKMGLVQERLSEPGPGVIALRCNGVPEAIRVGPPPTLPQRIYTDLEYTDFAGVGIFGEGASYILPDGGFLYSVLPFRVEAIIKSPATTPQAVGSTITVARPGGTLEIGGRYVTTVCPSDPSFAENTRYLVFFRLLPGTKVFRPLVAFKLAGGTAVRLGAPAGRPVLGAASLLRLARAQAERLARGEPRP